MGLISRKILIIKYEQRVRYVGILSYEQVSLVGLNVVFEIIGKVSLRNFFTV